MGKGARLRKEREQSAFSLTHPQEKAVRKAVRSQLLEDDLTYWLDMDAAVLWVLHKEFGFGAKRLRRFFDRFSVIHEEMRNYYQLDDDNNTWLCRFLLKRDVGVDVEAWEKEFEKKE